MSITHTSIKPLVVYMVYNHLYETNTHTKHHIYRDYIWKDILENDKSAGFFYFFIYFLATSRSTWALSSDQGSNPCPLQWKCGVLTTGPPGKSQVLAFYKGTRGLEKSDGKETDQLQIPTVLFELFTTCMFHFLIKSKIKFPKKNFSRILNQELRWRAMTNISWVEDGSWGQKSTPSSHTNRWRRGS